MPMGQMPVLEVDGHRLYQSTAIFRYIAKQVGLAGENDWENLQIDMMVETLKDLLISEPMFLLFCVENESNDLIFNFKYHFPEFTSVKYEPDEDIKEKKFADLKENIAPFYLGKLDAIAAENNGFMALGRVCDHDGLCDAMHEILTIFLYFQLTWADILLSPFTDCFNHVLECDVGEDYPNLKKVLDHLTENEGIRNWFETRPDTIY